MTTILVTGATGTIGSLVVKALRGAPGVKVRAAVRSGERASALAGDNVTTVDFDFDNAESIAKAVDGADKVFLVTPFVENPLVLGERLVDAAKKAGVKHIVKLSAFGCEHEPGIQLGRMHRAIEKKIVDFSKVVDIPLKEQQISRLESRMAEGDFWNDAARAQVQVNELKAIKGIVEPWRTLATAADSDAPSGVATSS